MPLYLVAGKKVEAVGTVKTKRPHELDWEGPSRQESDARRVVRTYETTHRAALWPAIPLLGTYPEKTVIPKYVCLRAHWGTIYNSQDVEATSGASTRQPGPWKMWVRTHSGILLSHKRQDSVICRDRAGPKRRSYRARQIRKTNVVC